MSKRMLCLGLVIGIAHASPRVLAEDKPAAAPEQSLLGQWKLNPDKSDNVQEKMRSRREAAGHEGGMGRGPRGAGGPGRGGPGGAGPGAGGPGDGGSRGSGGRGGHSGGSREGMGGGDRQQQSEARRELMEDLADPAKMLTIVAVGSELTLTTDDGRVRRVRPDGNAVKGEGGLERKAHWENGHLIVESSAGSTRITETWSFAPEEPKLHVTTRLDDQRGDPLVIQTAYNSVPRP